MTQAWINPRPRLTIDMVRSHYRNCVTTTVYRVTSTPFRVTRNQIDSLDKAGLLGSGQGFRVLSPCNGEEPPAFRDSVPCREFDAAGNAVGHAKDFPPHDVDVFVYEVERICDSGD